MHKPTIKEFLEAWEDYGYGDEVPDIEVHLSSFSTKLDDMGDVLNEVSNAFDDDEEMRLRVSQAIDTIRKAYELLEEAHQELKTIDLDIVSDMEKML